MKHEMKKAFTLIELLVAIGVFSILVAIGVGGFVNALHTQRQIAGFIAAQSNASVALEQMAREMRTGFLFCHDPGDPNPNATCFPSCTVTNVSGLTSVWTCNGIMDFYNVSNENVDYALQNGELARSVTGASGYTPITGSNIKVTSLVFTLFGSIEGDNWNPRVTISLGVSPSSSDPALASDVLHLQTTVSARQIDCPPGPSASC